MAGRAPNSKSDAKVEERRTSFDLLSGGLKHTGGRALRLQIGEARAAPQPGGAEGTEEASAAAAAQGAPGLQLRLVGADGAPLDGQRIEALLPDGSSAALLTGGGGKAQVDGAPAGPCRVSFPDIGLREPGPLPAELFAIEVSEKLVGRREEAKLFPATSGGGEQLFQLRRLEAHVFEAEHFREGSGVFVPEAFAGPIGGIELLRQAIAWGCHRGDVLIVTGHGPSRELAQARADSLLFALIGDRDRWSAAAAKSEPGHADPAVWSAAFDLHMRALEKALGTDAAGRIAMQDALNVFGGRPAAPPRPKPRGPAKPYLLIRSIDQIYPVKIAEIATGDANQYKRLDPLNPGSVLPNGGGWRNMIPGERIYLVPEWAAQVKAAGYDVRDEGAPQDDPKFGKAGRPLGYWHLVIRRTDSIWPVKMAEIAHRDYRELNKINPHLLKGPGQWKNLYAGDEINVPDEAWSQALAAKGYQMEADPAPEPPPPEPTQEEPPWRAAVACGAHHLDSPFHGAPRRRLQERRAEALFVRTGEEPSAICLADAPVCDSATCELYDPRAFKLVYEDGTPHEEDEKPFIEIAVVDAAGEPLALEEIEIVWADGTTLAAALDANGRFRREAVKPGPYSIVFPNLAEGEIALQPEA